MMNFETWRKGLTSTADFALVMATFIRRKSETKPIFCSSLHLTHEKITISFSRPYIQAVGHNITS
jgi:hypothetical protein